MRRAVRAVFPGANVASAGGTRLLDVGVLHAPVQPASDAPEADILLSEAGACLCVLGKQQVDPACRQA